MKTIKLSLRLAVVHSGAHRLCVSTSHSLQRSGYLLIRTREPSDKTLLGARSLERGSTFASKSSGKSERRPDRSKQRIVCALSPYGASFFTNSLTSDVMSAVTIQLKYWNRIGLYV